MITIRLLFAVLLFVGLPSQAMAQAKKKTGPNGEACISEGTQRKDGKDQDGNTVNCLWDTCTYCDQTGGQINCSIQKTSYSNPTDCKAAMTRPGGAAVVPETGGVLDPGTTPTRRPPVARPGGALQQFQQQ